MKEINFNELKELQSSNKKILLDVKAKWCQPCKILTPKLESIEKDYEHVEFVMLDVDDNQQDCINMGIKGVPTVIVYDGENVVSRSSGVQSDNFYKDILNTL